MNERMETQTTTTMDRKMSRLDIEADNGWYGQANNNLICNGDSDQRPQHES